MKRGQRVTRAGRTAVVVDVYADKKHIGVLPDDLTGADRVLVRWRLDETDES